jgi:hypothetical protein
MEIKKGFISNLFQCPQKNVFLDIERETEIKRKRGREREGEVLADSAVPCQMLMVPNYGEPGGLTHSFTKNLIQAARSL